MDGGDPSYTYCRVEMLYEDTEDFSCSGVLYDGVESQVCNLGMKVLLIRGDTWPGGGRWTLKGGKEKGKRKVEREGRKRKCEGKLGRENLKGR